MTTGQRGTDDLLDGILELIFQELVFGLGEFNYIVTAIGLPLQPLTQL
jgi:hypothetical protein